MVDGLRGLVHELSLQREFNLAIGERHSVRWAAHESRGLKSLRRSDEGRCIQRRG